MTVLFSGCVKDLSDKYPSKIPLNFKQTPFQLVCAREKPTSISISLYADQADKWRILISARENKEISLLFAHIGEGLNEFGLTPNGWKNAKDMTKQEIISLKMKLTASEEETLFLSNCYDKIGRYIEGLNFKKGLTPIQAL